MNFSDFFKLSGQLCCLSPDGSKFATAVLGKVVIRDIKATQLIKEFHSLDNIDNLEWSPDSTMILCGMFKRSLVQVWSLDYNGWTCKIDEGTAGLVDVRWSPDSRHILSTSEFYLRITIWSLVTKSVSYIKYPKNCAKYIDFTNDGKYMAVAEGRKSKDHISIFDCHSWSMTKHFCPDTENLDGLCWSPKYHELCVWESCLRYKVLIYSLEGHCLSTFSAHDQALGVKTVAWSPSSQLLAIASFDERVRLLNHLTWRLVEEFSHTEVSASGVLIYQEIYKTDNSFVHQHHRSTSCYEMSSPQEFHALTTRPSSKEADPKMGVSAIVFSPDSRYVASRSDSMPSCIWIWSFVTMKCCAILLQNKPVRDMTWDPVRPRLAFCTGSPDVFIWTPKRALSVPVPCKDGESFIVVRVKWLPTDGSRLALIGQGEMCWCYTPCEQYTVLD